MEESTGYVICISPAPAKGNTWFQLLDVYCKSQSISPDDLEGMEQHEAIGELYSYLGEAIPACIDEYRRKNSWQIYLDGDSSITVKLEDLGTTVNDYDTCNYNYGFLRSAVFNDIADHLTDNDSEISRLETLVSEKLNNLLGCQNVYFRNSDDYFEESYITLCFDLPYTEFKISKGRGKNKGTTKLSRLESDKSFVFDITKDFDADYALRKIEYEIGYLKRNRDTQLHIPEVAEWNKSYPIEQLSSSQKEQLKQIFSLIEENLISDEYIDDVFADCNKKLEDIAEDIKAELKVYKLGELTPLIPYIRVDVRPEEEAYN